MKHKLQTLLKHKLQWLLLLAALLGVSQGALGWNNPSCAIFGIKVWNGSNDQYFHFGNVNFTADGYPGGSYSSGSNMGSSTSFYCTIQVWVNNKSEDYTSGKVYYKIDSGSESNKSISRTKQDYNNWYNNDWRRYDSGEFSFSNSNLTAGTHTLYIKIVQPWNNTACMPTCETYYSLTFTIPEPTHSWTKDKTLYFVNNTGTHWSNAYLRIGHTSYNDAYSMTQVTGTVDYYSKTITNNDGWSGYVAFVTSNNSGTTGQNKTIYNKGSGGTLIDKSSAYQKVDVSEHKTLTISGSGTTTEGVTYYATNLASGQTKYRVTLGNPSNGTISATYTSGSGGTISQNSSADVLPTSFLTLSATPSSGYALDKFTITDGNGGTRDKNAGDTIIIRSNTTVTASFVASCTPPTVTPTGNSRCGAGSVTLSALTTAGTISWWASTTSESALGTGTSYEPSVSSTTTYFVSATDGGCTSDRVAVTATVYARPSISSTTPGSRCGTGTVTLSATATDSESGTLKIKWFDASSSGTVLQNSPSNNYTTAEISATTNYWVTVTNATKHTDTYTSKDFYCSASSRTQITATVSPEPTIDTQPASTVVACRGEYPSPSSLSVTATGTDLSYQWQLSTTSAEGPWSDLGGSEFKAASFNFGAATSGGTFYYRCKVTSSSCSDAPIYSDVSTLTVVGYPTAGSISGASSVCSGTNFTLTLSEYTSSGTTIQWQKSINGGSTWSNVTNGTPTGTTGATTASLTTSQTVATQYRAVVTTTTGGCSSETDGYPVAITPNASMTSVTLTSSSVCIGQGLSATAHDVVLSGGVGSWSSTDESVATVTSAGVITPKAAGSTNITYTITGGCGGTASDYATLTVKPNAAAAQYTLTNNTQTYNGDPRAVTVIPAPGARTATIYYTGTGSTSYAKSTTAPTNAGTYAVTVDAENGDDYCAATNLSVGTLTINKADQSPLTISNTLLDFAYCTGSHTTLTTSGGSGDGAVTYTITSGSGTVDVSTLTATANGSISVTATKAESANYNETTSAAKTFNFTYATPTPYAISAASTAICSGGGGTITLAGSQTGYNYLLYNGITPLDDEGEIKPGTGSAITFDVSSSGVYTAKGYYGTNRENCLTDMEETVVMTISTTPKLVRSATEVTNYTPVTITSVNTDIETWSITNESDTAYSYDKTANSITFKGLSNKSPYTVTATTHGGCSNTTTITVNADTEVCP